MRRLARALAAGSLAAMVLAVLVFSAAGDLSHKDAADYAQISRALTVGEGFVSRQAIYALHLRFLKDHDLLAGPWPNLHRFPLQSLALVPLFSLLGPSLIAILLTGILFSAASAALLFDWADSTLGRWPAVALVALFTLNGAFFFEVAAGIPEFVTCLFFLLATYFLLAPTRRQGQSWRSAASGAALGLAILARTGVITALPGMLLVAWRSVPQGRARRCLLLAGALVVVLAPWGVRNTRLAGSPTFSLHSYFLVPTAAAPGWSKKNFSLDWVSEFVSPVEFMARHPYRVWAKWKRNASALTRGYPWLAGTFLVPLLAWLALVPRLGGPLHSLGIIACAGFVANAALCNLTDVNPERYSYFLVGPMMLLAVGVVWSATRAIDHPTRRVAVLFAATLVMSQPMALTGAVERIRKREPTLPAQDIAVIQAWTSRDAVVFSDASHLIAWYTGRRAIRNHYTVTADGSRVLALLDFDDEFGPIDALYLSVRFLDSSRLRSQFERLRADPRFATRFRCLPPLSKGALLCIRQSPSTALE